MYERVMRQLGLLISILAAVSSVTVATSEERNLHRRLPDAIRQEQDFDAAESSGLFIGIRQFTDPGIAEVPYAVDDAVDLAYTFAVELELVRPEAVSLALSGNPQKEVTGQRLKDLVERGAKPIDAKLTSIYTALEKISEENSAKGLFVAVVATHGFSDEGADYLLASDTRLRFRQSTAISVSVVLDQISRAKSLRRLVLFDACRERLPTVRKIGVDPETAMGQTFLDAMNNAKGQVILSGTTLGGYSYDDHTLKNGVFSASVIDGLRGQASHDAKGLIRVSHLHKFVNDRVESWVQRNKEEHIDLSRGISGRFDGPAAEMPLAIARDFYEKLEDYQRRRDAALEKLRDNILPPIDGSIYDSVARILNRTSLGSQEIDNLISEIMHLNGSARSRRVFVDYYHGRKSKLHQLPNPASHAKPAPPTTEFVHRWEKTDRGVFDFIVGECSGDKAQKRFECNEDNEGKKLLAAERPDSTIEYKAIDDPRDAQQGQGYGASLSDGGKFISFAGRIHCGKDRYDRFMAQMFECRRLPAAPTRTKVFDSDNSIQMGSTKPGEPPHDERIFIIYESTACKGGAPNLALSGPEIDSRRCQEQCEREPSCVAWESRRRGMEENPGELDCYTWSEANQPTHREDYVSTDCGSVRPLLLRNPPADPQTTQPVPQPALNSIALLNAYLEQADPPNAYVFDALRLVLAEKGYDVTIDHPFRVEGTLFAGTSVGVFRYENGIVTRLPEEKTPILGIYVDADGVAFQTMYGRYQIVGDRAIKVEDSDPAENPQEP